MPLTTAAILPSTSFPIKCSSNSKNYLFAFLYRILIQPRGKYSAKTTLPGDNNTLSIGGIDTFLKKLLLPHFHDNLMDSPLGFCIILRNWYFIEVSLKISWHTLHKLYKHLTLCCIHETNIQCQLSLKILNICHDS